jgi:hypothetical protein
MVFYRALASPFFERRLRDHDRGIVRAVQSHYPIGISLVLIDDREVTCRYVVEGSD